MTTSMVILGLNVFTLALQCVILVSLLRTLGKVRETREQVEALLRERGKAVRDMTPPANL